MAAGLSFVNPYASEAVMGEAANPYASASSPSLGGMAPSLADMSALGQALAPPTQFQAPQAQQPPSIAYSPSRKEFFVQGNVFSADDAPAALQAEGLLTRPGVGLPTEGDWAPLDTASYQQYLQSVRSPSLGRLASKSFGRGIDQLQMLAGRGLQLAGAEETGGRIVEQQEEDLRRTSPYERQFTDIESGRGAVEWFVANFAQQGPNMIESVLTAGLGFLAGTATGGPLAGVGGAMAGLMGKTAFKEAVIAAARKKAAGEALNTAENKLLREAAGIAGAVTASYAQNLSMGASDIYGELREQGADVDDMDARLKALAGSVPYAALETLPEYLLASRVFGGVGARAALPGATTTTTRGAAGTTTVTTEPSRLARGAELLRRGAVGFGVGGVAEGLTETGQESLLLGISGQDFSDPENVNRLINSFAAGFGIGGPLGAAANLRSRQPENLLNPAQNPDQTPGRELIVPPPPPPTPSGTAVTPFTTPVTPMGAIPTPPAQLAGTPSVPQLTGPVPPVSPIGGPVIMAGMGPNAADVTRQDLLLQQTGNVPPGVTPGSQGVLDVFGGTIPAQELAARMQQPQEGLPQLPAPVPGVTPDQGQGVLQFAPAAPGQTDLANPQMSNQLQVIQDQLRRQREFEAAQAQQQALIEQQTEQIAQDSRNARDIFAMQQQQNMLAAQMGATPLPMRPSGPAQPQQLPLFPRRELPVPSRAEGLRRGVGTQIEPLATEQAAAPRGRQLPLITQEGQPSVAALKAAGVRGKVPAPVPLAGGKQAPPTGKRVTPASIAKAVAETEEKASPARGLKRQAGVVKTEEKKDAVQKPSAKKVSPRKQPEAGQGVGGKVPRKREAARKGEALKAKTIKAKVEDKRPAVQTAKVKPDLVRKGELVRAGRQWSQYADPETQPKWSELTPEQQEQWRKEVIDEGRPNIAATEAIAPPKKAEAVKTAAPAQEVEVLPPAEAWEDMKPEGAPAFEALPPAMQSSWTRMVERNRASAAEADVIAASYAETVADTAALSPAEVLANDIATAEATTDIAVFKDSIQTILNYAFFAGEDTNIKKLVDQARGFLNNTDFSDEQLSAMDEAFLDSVQYQTKLEATYKSATKNHKKGEMKPWFSYAVSRNLLPSVKAQITNMPEQYKTQTDPVTGVTTQTKPEESSAEKMAQTPEALLGQLIEDLVSKVREYAKLTQPINFNGASYDNIVALATELYAATSKQGREYIVRGYKLKDYFKADGSPKMLKSAGRYLFTTTELTAAEQRRLEQEQREAAKIIAEQENAERVAEFEREQMEREAARPSYTKSDIDRAADNINEDYDSTDGMFYRADGTPDSKTIPAGRVRLLVKNFLSKLKAKPNTFVYANVADLKQRNPDLYRRAAAARSQGDFDTTNAVGYSFGPNVIIFTDFARSEQQLKFVLAHETLGHFGFKGVIPKKDLDTVLNRIYDLDPDLQAAVDAMVSNRGMAKLEAIEEYLADNAAELDTSLIARMWAVLKNFLNKLGFEFQDDEARYLVGQARKYVRQGDAGNFINARNIMGGLDAIAQDEADGRYARVYAGNMGSRVFAAGAMNRRYGGSGGLLGSMEAFAKNVFGSRRDVPGTINRILEQVQTLDNKARRSFGLSQIYRVLEKQQSYARALLSKYQRMTSFTHSPKVFGFGKGVEESDKERAGELLARAALYRAEQATDERIKSFDPLVSVDAMGNVTVDPAVRSAIEKAGFVTAEEFRKGFDIKYSDGSTVRFQYDVDETSPEWKVYTELRDTVNEAAIDLMLSNYEAAQAETSRVINDLNNKRTGANVFTAEDLAAIREAATLYQNIRYAGSDVANAGVEIKKKASKDSEDFLIAFGRALFNDDVYAAWVKDPNANPKIVKDMEEFLKAEYDDIRAQLPSLRAKVKNDEQSFQVQKAVRDLFLFDLQSKNADFYAKRTILGSYVPFNRRGEEQVRLVAVDARGNPVALDENVRSALPYFQFSSRSEAMDAAAALDEQFGGDNEFVLLDENGSETTVKLKAEVSRTRQSPDLTESVNFNEFVYVLNRLNINLAPEVRERIVTTLTNQNSRARKNLQRSGTEGWDKDVVRSVSEHLETSAHVAAKKLYRHRLDDILMNNSNWLGDSAKLTALKAAVDNAQTDGQRARAQRAYDEYAYMYKHMAGSAGQKTVNIDGKEVPTLGRGEDYREEAKQVLRWYSETTNITDSTEDMLSGEAGSALKLAAVLLQLGGSVATAVINLASLVTHSVPYLSYYNPKRGFGGGYGEVKAATALWKAAGDLKNVKLSDAAFLEEMMRDASYEKYGLTENEAQFLFDQTEQGTLQASQFNALVGTARGKVFNNKAQAAVKLWMSMFSYTEQFNRRVTALAAYRLEKERLISQGVTDETQLNNAATEVARNAVNSSQGEYAMFNRPEMARGNVLQYIFMYKQFVIITVQLLKALPPKGQMMMLGFLLLSSGLKGLPFAEDIFDIVDTIAQKLGLKMGSVEKEIAEWIDSVAPGMTPYAMRGVLDRVTGATMSTRLGMGDLVPLTGAFKAGADPAREAADFAGPVFSGLSGLVGTAGSLAKYGAEAIGLRDDTTSFSSILRDSPAAAIRGVTDGLSYLNTGMITNNRGQVVSREAPGHVILARMLGFYPAIATQQNDIVRMSKDVGDYAKSIKADYVSAYVKAKLANDNDRMQSIAADVRRWNEDAKGTGLEITTFTRSANRAAQEAARPTVLRYLKSAPKQMRPETIELLRLNGLEDEVR